MVIHFYGLAGRTGPAMISRSGLHAIRALAILASTPGGRSLGTAAIARRIEAPPNYLGKLLRVMGRTGLVRSRKGTGGGFRLARDPSSIRLLDVVEPIDHVARWTTCLLTGSPCSLESPCAVHPRWARVREDYLDLLATTTIADVAGSVSPLPQPPPAGGDR